MGIQDLISSKTEARDELKTKHNLPRRSKILIGIKLWKTSVSKEFISGLSILPANFIVFSEKKIELDEKNIRIQDSESLCDMNGFDAFISECSDIKIEKLMEAGVVPIVNSGNYLWKILSEFHPWRAEGNSYLFESWSHWSAYYALIRYLENHKFPYDNRNLVKNVLWV